MYIFFDLLFGQLFLNDQDVFVEPGGDAVHFFDVGLDVLLFAGAVRADLALERLGAGVDAPVLVQLGAGQKVFSAFRTDVFSLNGVRFQVLSQRPFVGITLAAQLAHGLADALVMLCN